MNKELINQKAQMQRELLRKKIAGFIEASGKTKGEFKDATDQSILSRLLAGKRDITTTTLFKLAAALNIEPKAFFEH